MVTDLNELERLAREATPGTWRRQHDPAGAVVYVNGDGHRGYAVVADGIGRGADAEYIAAASPATILALTHEVRRAEGASESWAEIAGEETARANRLEAELKALREAGASLLAFAERNQCTHEDTERLGVIWERCRMCDRQWADDRGGKPEYVDPPEIEAMRAALEPVKP